jgi:site-specific recombinase XerD
MAAPDGRLIDLFLDMLSAERGAAANTVDAYRRDLNDFAESLTRPLGEAASEDIRAYGRSVTARVQRWWAALPDKSCRGDIKTYYGLQPLHHLLERCTWHSAQHARQIISVLERFAIEANGPLTARDYAGLPMPAGLWE